VAKDDPTLKRWRELGFVLNRSGVSVHLFYIGAPLPPPNSLLPILQPVTATAGSAHIYSDFDPVALHTAIFETLTTTYLWDSQMRLRVSAGVKITSISGNVVLREKTVHGPVMSTRDSIGYELTIDDEVKTPQVIFQAAVIWTDNQFRRLLRVMTFAVPISAQALVIKSSVDEAAMATYLVKQSASLVTQMGPAETALLIRRKFTSITAGGKFRSLYHLIHALLGSLLLRQTTGGGEEQRLKESIQLKAASINSAILYLYPRFFIVDNGKDLYALSSEAFTHGYVVVVHSWDRIYVWVNPEADSNTIKAFFGTETPPLEVPRLPSEQNIRLNEVITESFALSGKYLPVEVIQPNSPREAIFESLLVDMSQSSGSDLAQFISSVYH
jgi:hypothetical protein